MSTDSIEKLYKNFGILADAKDKLVQHEKEYLEILTAVKGSPKEKRLASQFIARFFKHFPKLADQAIDAHLDLCEDEDMAIRKQAIKDLPALCKDNKEHTARIADILAQLLQAEDSSELAVVHNSIMSLMKSDPKGTLSGFFSQILNGDDGTRERCIKFLATKLKAIGHDIITKEPEDLLIAECKKVLQDVTADEFHSIMEILAWTRLGSTVTGQQELVDITIEQAELSVPFKHTNVEQWNRLVQCVKHALPFFSGACGQTYLVDPTDTEETFCFTKAKPGTMDDHGIVVQAALPQHGQISEMFVIGSLDVDTIEHSMDLLSGVHKDICPLLEQCLVKTIFRTFRSNSEKTDDK